MTENLIQYGNKPDVEQVLQEGLEAVEGLLFKIVDSDVAVLREASRHILGAGGKRIRPRLVLLSYAASGGHDFEAVVPIAAAVELVHTATLVHDDINDHGIMRRGRPSVNALWGRTFALLTGDFLFTKVYELMAPFKDLNIIFANATVALVEGETLQASAVKENVFSREMYYQIIARKTAALFQASASLGAKFAGAAQKHIEILGHYGYNIGLAFQIIDDILDLTEDEEKLGKTAGLDLAQGKGYAVAHTNNGKTNTAAVADSADPMLSLKQKLLQGDAIEEGQNQAKRLVEQAVYYISALPDSPARQALINLAGQTIHRDH